jgi:hypothetical protein
MNYLHSFAIISLTFGVICNHSCNQANATSAPEGIALSSLQIKEDGSLTRCEAKVSAEGFEKNIPAWGLDEETASNNARQAARYIAETHRMIDGWSAMFAMDIEYQEFSSDTGSSDETAEEVVKRPEEIQRLIDSVLQQWNTSSVDTNRVPGYSITIENCVALDISKKKKQQWTVSWNATTTSGFDLGSTIEQARRYDCGLQYKREQFLMFENDEVFDKNKKIPFIQSKLAQAHEHLAQCFQNDSSSVLLPSKSKIKAISETAALCIGELPNERMQFDPQKAIKTPVGIGGNSEIARENAWSEWRMQTYRIGVAEALDALAHAPPYMRSQMLANGYSKSMNGLLAISSVENRLTWCSELSEPVSNEWTWSQLTWEEEGCFFAAKSWQSQTVTGTDQLIVARDEHCLKNVWSIADDIKSAVENSPEDVTLTMWQRGWGLVLFCDALCSNNSLLDSKDLVPIDRNTYKNSKQFTKAMDRAVAQRDLTTQLSFIPQLSLIPQVRDAMLMHPERSAQFLDRMQELQKEGTLYDFFVPSQYKGRWFLEPNPNGGKSSSKKQEIKESLRDEIPFNLRGIKTAQLAYDADFDMFVPVEAYPPLSDDNVPRDWLMEESGGFETIGWMPDPILGQVRGTYWVTTTQTNFTAWGIIDVDGDGEYATYKATKSENPNLPVTGPKVY